MIKTARDKIRINTSWIYRGCTYPYIYWFVELHLKFLSRPDSRKKRYDCENSDHCFRAIPSIPMCHESHILHGFAENYVHKFVNILEFVVRVSSI